MPLHGPSFAKGLILMWCDQLDEARSVLADEYRSTLDRGDEASLPFLLYGFTQLECLAGNWGTARRSSWKAAGSPRKPGSWP
jgi:hypothetical protein